MWTLTHIHSVQAPFLIGYSLLINVSCEIGSIQQPSGK